MESWKRFVEEAESGGTMQNLLGKKYEDFVSTLQSSIKDPRVQAVLRGGLKDRSAADDVVTFTNTSPAVRNLIPTQKEVDIDKSLAYPLRKDPPQFIEKVTSDGPFTVGSRIVTYANKYVMDGHHRWSTIYAVNKNASINAINMNIEGLGALDALKLIQMAIGVQKKAIPMQFVEGNNLFTIDWAQFRSWIEANVSPKTLALIDQNPKAKAAVYGTGAINELELPFSSDAKMAKALDSEDAQAVDIKKVNALAKYAWSNIVAMRKTSQPVEGAPERGYMPQTDNTNFMEPLKKGEIDIKPPYMDRTSKQKTGE
tara:strand:+ start:344 stop:1282 length:939 start_codon:yes stop_codon:yes gene_type:complete